MRLFSFRSARTVAIAASCLFSAGWVLATAPIVDHDLLPMVPEGAEIVSGWGSGKPVSFLVMTRSNTVDLTDFQSLTGADASRVIRRVVLIATSGPEGLLTEHVLLANGHYDPRNIFSSALASGATQSQYLRLPVLIVPPMQRNRDIAPDVRWLILIDGNVAVFGAIATVQEALSRYLDRTSPDPMLWWNLAHLRADDQSWSIVAPSVRGIEMVRQSLVPLDASLADPMHAQDGLILGIHFGRKIEVEYVNERDWQGADAKTRPAEPIRPRVPPTFGALRGYTFRNEQSPDYHVIKVSRQRYEKWIAGQTSLPGEPPPQADQLLARKKRIR